MWCYFDCFNNTHFLWKVIKINICHSVNLMFFGSDCMQKNVIQSYFSNIQLHLSNFSVTFKSHFSNNPVTIHSIATEWQRCIVWYKFEVHDDSLINGLEVSRVFTCVFVSGLAHFNSPDLLSCSILSFSLCAKTRVKGIHSSVSSVAYPNISPCEYLDIHCRVVHIHRWSLALKKNMQFI